MSYLHAKFIEIPSYNEGENGQFILEERMVYYSLILDNIVIPAGFVTDFASIPRIFRAIHPVNGRHRKAAVVHDYLCRSIEVKRKDADNVFLEAMKVCGVKGWRSRQMFLAVRIGGWMGGKK